MFVIASFACLSAQDDFAHINGIWVGAGPNRGGFEFGESNRVAFTSAVSRNGIWVVPSKSGIYRIDLEYNVPFLIIYWDDGTSERYLMLINERFMVLYNNNTEPVFFLHRPWIFGRGNSMGGMVSFSLIESVTASSSLVHGGIHFAATRERLGTHINRVWAVEGGIGERLFARVSPVCNYLYISIGYVHFTRPYLFKANSRPKRIRISNAHDETRFFELELADTPNYQRISGLRGGILEFTEVMRYGVLMTTQDIIIEILEVRPGFRYNHMCINSLMNFSIWTP